MKNLSKFATLGAVLVASASVAFGATIQLASYGQAGLTGYDPVVNGTGLANSAMTVIASATNTTFASIPSQSTVAAAGTNLTGLPGYTAGYSNPSGTAAAGATAFELNPSTIWTAAPTGSAYVGALNNFGPVGTYNPTFGYYEYQTTINGLLTSYSGTLSVLADDTTEILLTNSAGTTTVVGFGALGGDSQCADNQPDCISVDNVGLTLLAGNNTLTFIVEQAGNTPAGVQGGVGNPSGVAFDASLSNVPEPSSLMLLGSGLIGAAGMFFRRRVTA